MMLVRTHEGKNIVLELKLTTKNVEAHSTASDQKFDLESLLGHALQDLADKIGFDASVDAYLKGR